MSEQLNWKVTAVLASPLAGEPPQLDAILEYEMAQRHGKAMTIDRGRPCPPIGSIHLPLLRGRIGPVDGLPRCSSPILPACQMEHEFFAKRLSVENASMLREDQRTVVSVGSNWTKSYRLPLLIRRIDRVCWFVGGSRRRSLRSLLKTVKALGHKRSQGFGRVAEWIVEPEEHDLSWFAPSPEGPILMRIMPLCDDLPANLQGFRRSFGGVVAPYWHPDRQMEIAVPC